jgi:multiple sugar transport system substrate-binding protein
LEFLDLARFFSRPDEDLHGCVVAAKPDGHNDVYDFLIHLWSRGGVFLDERRRPVFAGPEGEEALRFYLGLIHEHSVTQPRPWEYDSVAAGEYYASGRAAMMWNWCGFQTVADLPESSKIPGKTRSTMLPGGDGPAGEPVSLIVYWVMTIPAGSHRRDAAWAFMRHLASPEMDKVTALAGGSGVRRSTWHDPEVRRQFGYYAIVEEVHRRARTLPAIPEYPAINDVIDRMMAGAVTGGRPIPDALREASQETEQILAAAGYYR